MQLVSSQFAYVNMSIKSDNSHMGKRAKGASRAKRTQTTTNINSKIIYLIGARKRLTAIAFIARITNRKREQSRLIAGWRGQIRVRAWCASLRSINFRPRGSTRKNRSGTCPAFDGLSCPGQVDLVAHTCPTWRHRHAAPTHCGQVSCLLQFPSPDSISGTTHLEI